MQIGAADPSLTGSSGLLAVAELVERLVAVPVLDAAVGAVKERNASGLLGRAGLPLAADLLAGNDDVRSRAADLLGCQPRSPPAQLTLALDGQLDVVDAVSFIITNLPVDTPAQAVTVEAWFRGRVAIEERCSVSIR